MTTPTPTLKEAVDLWFRKRYAADLKAADFWTGKKVIIKDPAHPCYGQHGVVVSVVPTPENPALVFELNIKMAGGVFRGKEDGLADTGGLECGTALPPKPDDLFVSDRVRVVDATAYPSYFLRDGVVTERLAFGVWVKFADGAKKYFGRNEVKKL